jgi:hypothetical protein
LNENRRAAAPVWYSIPIVAELPRSRPSSAIPVALVEVDVGDAVVAAPVGARDGAVGDVGASDAERRCVLLDVADRQR